MMKVFSISLFVFFLSVTSVLWAEPLSVRWTGAEDKNAEFQHVLQVLNQQTGYHLSPADFKLVDDRDLAHNHYQMYVQVADEIPLKRRSLRLWTQLNTGQLIQAEALVESDQQLDRMRKMSQTSFRSLGRAGLLNRQKKFTQLAMDLIRQHPEDRQVRHFSAQEVWEDGQLVYLVVARAKHGTHEVKISVDSQKVIGHSYEPFPNADPAGSDSVSDEEFSVPALVYPIYEETEKLKLQNRIRVDLRHLKRRVKSPGQDPYSPLRNRSYLSSKQDPILGLTEKGQADGYWAMSDIKAKAALLFDNLPMMENSFSKDGAILEGRYATIHLHPDAVKTFKGIQFSIRPSAIFSPLWSPVGNPEETDEWEMVPGSSLLGKPLAFYEEALQRPARRLPDHSPLEYINDGFDEIQVYYAINTLMESLHEMGFQDPELSTRPFHAFLYDPDIGSRNNAYYTDDTINFTTYSPDAQNFARDNSTIWHELGHGVMDRLMGDYVHLADTGGLSEGMADFIGSLVIEKVTLGQPFEGSEDFRINNTMGFSLTNEVHDDGESYGGAMQDILVQARQKYGTAGVDKVGDLTLETMRLCRNHPGITADIWFSHMLFADQLGNLPIRASGELKDLILRALSGRNFSLDGKKPGQFKITYKGTELDDKGPGSRGNPIVVTVQPNQNAVYSLQVSAIDGELYKFSYPLTVRVRLQGGPLQGALHWQGEEASTVDYVLQSPKDSINLDLSVGDKCDFVNREDGSCVDFAYVQLWPPGALSPVAKKRFYLRLKPQPN